MANTVKSSVNGEVIAINNQKEEKIMENVVKMEEKPMEKTLEQQYEELKAKNSPVLAKTKVISQPRKPTPKPTKKVETKPKGGESMVNWRTEAEKLLIEACRECKVDAPVIANPPGTSKSGVGSLQARVHGGVKITIRDMDRNKVLIYAPHDVIGYGFAHPGEYGKYCTFIPANSKDMKKAFIKALKDKKTGLEWRAERKFSMVMAKGTKAEKAALIAAAKTVKKVHAKAKTVVAKVTEPVTPTIETPVI